MNKALKLVLMYLIFFLVLLTVGTALYFFYLNLLEFVIGIESSTSNIHKIITSFFYVTTVLVIIMEPVTIYYRIRHIGGLPQLISFILLSVVAWNLLLPSIFKLRDAYFKRYPQTTVEKVVTHGYFRNSNGEIYYLTDDLSEKNEYAVSVVIRPEEKESVLVEKILNSPDLSLYKDAEPYNDILIKNSFPTKLVNQNYLSFDSFLDRGEKAFNKGFTFWLGYLSLALVICSLYGVSNFFDWRLINTTVILSLTCIILTFNKVYFLPVFSVYKIRYIQSKEFFQFLGRFMDDPFLCLINVFSSLIFITIGIIKYIQNRKKA